jgi:hypothetical protein
MSEGEEPQVTNESAQSRSAVASMFSKRLLRVIGVVVTVTVAVAITIAVTGGVRTIGPGDIHGRATADILDITEDGMVLGVHNAPVTLQYFGDLASRRGREFTLSTLPEIISRWVRKGILRIEYRALRESTDDPQAFDNQQVAALAAGQQNKLWYFLEIFYDELEPGRDGTANFSEQIARQIPGLNLERWKTARGDPTVVRQRARDALIAKQFGIEVAPAFLIGRTGQAMKRLNYRSLTEPAVFERAIEMVYKSIG